MKFREKLQERLFLNQDQFYLQLLLIINRNFLDKSIDGIYE